MKLTLLIAMVPLEHHKTPPENSELMLHFIKTCLNSDNLSSLTKTVSCGSTLPLHKGSRVNILLSSSSTRTKKTLNLIIYIKKNLFITFHWFVVNA